MGKAKLFVGLIFFVIFATLGFCVAGKIPQALNVATLPVEKQQNYLIIYVDSLTQPSPKVVSLWAILISSDTSITSLKAQSLYPSANPQGGLVAQAFALNQKGLPSDEFLSIVRSTFSLPLNNYILIDYEGLATLHSLWLGTPPSTIQGNSDEVLLISQGCEYIRQNKNTPSPGQSWTAIIPKHFRTDLAFDDAIQRWNQLVQAGNKLNCEVFDGLAP